MRQSEVDLALALALSAGLHLIAMMTLDLSPGAWRHGFQPALRVVLKEPPPESALTEVAASQASRPEPAAARRAEQTAESGRRAADARPGASLPLAGALGEHYYTAHEVDVAAEAIERGPLVIPELAYVSRLAGSVRARVYIGEDGAVESVSIVEARPRGGIFENAATEALRQVRYKPAEIAGRPVKSQKLVEVNFNPYEDRDTNERRKSN